MERILRNRRAAHASREKKRRHVEHLEAYVLALEKNNVILSASVAKLSTGASESLIASLEQPKDLSELKANVSSMCPAPAPYPNSEDGDLSTSEDHESAVKMEYLSPLLVSEKNHPPETEDIYTMDATSQFYSYLSPVSLHLPLELTLRLDPSSVVASPQDLEYNCVDQLNDVSLPTSRPDILAQNSEVILSPRTVGGMRTFEI